MLLGGKMADEKFLGMISEPTPEGVLTCELWGAEQAIGKMTRQSVKRCRLDGKEVDDAVGQRLFKAL